jgi:hypothetical protein
MGVRRFTQALRDLRSDRRAAICISSFRREETEMRSDGWAGLLAFFSILNRSTCFLCALARSIIMDDIR